MEETVILRLDQAFQISACPLIYSPAGNRVGESLFPRSQVANLHDISSSWDCWRQKFSHKSFNKLIDSNGIFAEHTDNWLTDVLSSLHQVFVMTLAMIEYSYAPAVVAVMMDYISELLSLPTGQSRFSIRVSESLQGGASAHNLRSIFKPVAWREYPLGLPYYSNAVEMFKSPRLI
jgi:hypothetical protein